MVSIVDIAILSFISSGRELEKRKKKKNLQLSWGNIMSTNSFYIKKGIIFSC